MSELKKRLAMVDAFSGIRNRMIGYRELATIAIACNECNEARAVELTAKLDAMSDYGYCIDELHKQAEMLKATLRAARDMINGYGAQIDGEFGVRGDPPDTERITMLAEIDALTATPPASR